ncbi:hypothetical protein VP01_4236g1, partial [Puccinia sorghi]
VPYSHSKIFTMHSLHVGRHLVLGGMRLDVNYQLQKKFGPNFQLSSHPQAQIFQNQPFPELKDLSIIFGTTPAGKKSLSIGQGHHLMARSLDHRRASSKDDEETTGPNQNSISASSQLGGGSHLTDEDAICMSIEQFQNGSLATELSFKELMAGFGVLEGPSILTVTRYSQKRVANFPDLFSSSRPSQILVNLFFPLVFLTIFMLTCCFCNEIN